LIAKYQDDYYYGNDGGYADGFDIIALHQEEVVLLLSSSL
jgi:hypothetical protein